MNNCTAASCAALPRWPSSNTCTTITVIPVDLNTSSVTTAVTACAVAVGLPLVMGTQVSTGTRCAQVSLLLLSWAWACFIAATSLSLTGLNAAALVMVSLASYQMLQALAGWLGPRPCRWPMIAAGLALPLGHLVNVEAAVRDAWTLVIGIVQCGLLVYAALLGQHQEQTWRWRVLLTACFTAYALLALVHLASIVLPASGALLVQLELFSSRWGHLVVQTGFVLMAIAVLVAWRREAEAALEALANSDSLTGLPNRRGWLHGARPLLAQARRNGWPTMVMMIDLDFFKQINDDHGHQMGDRALALLGRCMRACLRESDLAGRFGGEEFVILMPQTNVRVAELMDARLRAYLREHSREQLGLEMNFSSGLAPCDFRSEEPLRQALLAADKAMYQAKTNGRGHMHSSVNDLP